jgi:hypothetical protein
MRKNHTPKRLCCLPLALALFFLSPPAFAASAKCFLHGLISPSSGNLEKSSVSDMIRMRFDADNQPKCEKMLKAYCQYNVKEKNYSPSRLKGSFKPDTEKTEEVKYTFDAKCKLLTDGE